jgi:hypothetical protein
LAARDSKQGIKVIETERDPIAPLPGLILEWAREGFCEERTLLAGILPDGGSDVAASQRVWGLLLVAFMFPPLLN